MEPAEREERQPRALWVLVGGLALLGVVLAAVIASCAGTGSGSGATATTAAAVTTTAAAAALDDVVGTAGATAELTMLSGLLDEAGLTGTLQGDGPFTVFAPTDEAFAAVPADVLAEIEATPDLLGQVLSYHVVEGNFASTDLATRQLATVSGEALDVTVDGGTVTVGDATVTEADIAATNGVIHLIDQVLIPPSVTDALGASPDSSAPAETDLIDTAAGAGGFTTLASLLDEAGLTETLRGEGPYTVFAPTDDAFAALRADVLDALEKNPNALRRVLSYHVVPGSLLAADLSTGPLDTLEGGSVDIESDGGTVTVGGAAVTQPDVVASNGVLHGIDAVLLPPDLDLVAIQDDADYAVYFATGSAELNARANKVVEAAAAAIKELPAGSEVTLIGVADQRGDVAFNEQLSRDRAAAVQVELEVLGAEADYVIDAKGAEANQNLAKARRVNIALPRG